MSTPPAASFFKLSGAGNDFIALVEPAAAPDPDRIRAWCRRGLSLGADGVFTLARQPRSVRMVYYNADGGRSGLCLNGSRCAARLALELGWAARELDLETDAGVLHARRAGEDRVALELPDVVGEPRAVALEAGGRRYDGVHLEVGVPHLVLPWPESLGRAPVAELGAALRRHPDLGEAGANVNFVRFLPASSGEPSRCEIRTFERGVEAETLACGSGVVAAAAAGVAAGRLTLPVTALTAGGCELIVRGGDGGGDGGRPRQLEGDARIVARGELAAGAAPVPAPAAWS